MNINARNMAISSLVPDAVVKYQLNASSLVSIKNRVGRQAKNAGTHKFAAICSGSFNAPITDAFIPA